MVYDPWGIKTNDPNKGREPFDPKGNDNSVPVPGHPDWAKRKKKKKNNVANRKTNDINSYG